MRHFLALGVDSCSKSTDLYIQEMKFRLEATMEAYGTTGIFKIQKLILQDFSRILISLY